MTEPSSEPSSAPNVMGDRGTVPAPAQLHRVLAALAGVSVLIALNGPWRDVAAVSRRLGTLFAVAFPLVLAAIVLALAARQARLRLAADLTILVVGLVEAAVPFRSAFQGRTAYRFDEAALSHLAARAIAHGHNPYTAHWPSATAHAPTLLFDGRLVDRYGYPPLSPLLAAVVARVAPGTSETAVLGLVALLATGVLAFVLAPAWARPLAVLAVVTVSELPFLSQNGYPYATATPFLVLAVAGWTRVGAGGRLGRRGAVQAVALGLAVSAQQYVWFLAPLLLVVLWRVRRGDLDRRAAGRVLGRVLAIVVGVFVVVDLPFAIDAPHAWLSGILSPLTQHALYNGPGLLNVSVRILPGSGNLAFYGYAALVLYVALLVAVALWPRQLAAAAVVLPVLVFWISLRAQAIYYSQIGTVALVAAVTLTREDVAGARPLTVSPRVRRAVPAALAAVVAGLLVAGVATPAPLDVRAALAGPNLDVRLRNTSDGTVRPQFVTEQGSSRSLFWRVLSGPAELRPGQSARYLLAPPPGTPRARRAGRLDVVSDDPQAVSVGTISG